MKKNNKGFTLVELIVVLVILAILAAILVPALLGYIDKAREKQITTNAEAAYVAAQAILNEQYGLNKTASQASAKVTPSEIKKLTDITESFKISFDCGSQKTDGTNTQAVDSKHKGFIITEFSYTSNETNGKEATWNPISGEWTVDEP